jgi:prepilin-type processing-associated H-X9-DG protein
MAPLEMNANRMWRTKTPSFTRTELLVVLALVGVLGCLLIPALQRSRQRALRIRCTSNLKQIGMSFKTWALENNDRFPSQALTNQSGDLKPEAATNVYLHFGVMSNELSTPYILHCPADVSRQVAKDFENVNNTNISYFVGLDAVDTTPQMFLTGDRNLTNGLPVTNHVLFLAPNLPVGWTHELHSGQGNIGLADGSVQGLSSFSLRLALTNGSSANRLLMP